MIELKHGDCIEMMRTIPDASVHCCVTSPPYWGLRDYGHDGQIGLESTPEAYVARMVDVFREVRRVLREDGTLWLNLGDTYAANRTYQVRQSVQGEYCTNDERYGGRGSKVPEGLKPKDLIGIPWRVAFALQADGWYLRQDIIWHKPNPMPESVRDRCTKAHEYVFLLTKSERYHYDSKSLKEKSVTIVNRKTPPTGEYKAGKTPSEVVGKNTNRGGKSLAYAYPNGIPFRNRRSVWTIATKSYRGAHFATMPPDLAEPCILAGCPEGGTVLDPFAGSGTTLAVAAELGRSGIGCELNGEYINLAKQRIAAARAKCALFQPEETAFVNSGDDQ